MTLAVATSSTVREQMLEMVRWLGVGNVLTLLQLATLPADLTRKNMELFAPEVSPALRLEAVPVVGTSLGGWVAAELAALYPARVDRLVLVDAVGLWIDAAPMGELFGSTPPELATMIFHDQEHPLAQMMRAMTPTAIAEVPEAFAYAQLKALEASAKI